MSTFDDPNRQAVGLAPIWTGAGETAEPQAAKAAKAEPAPEPEPEKADTKAKKG